MSKTHNIEDWGKEIMFSTDVDWMISVEDNSLTYPKPHQLSEKIKQTLEDFSTHIKKERDERYIKVIQNLQVDKPKSELEEKPYAVKKAWLGEVQKVLLKDLSTPEANK